MHKLRHLPAVVVSNLRVDSVPERKRAPWGIKNRLPPVPRHIRDMPDLWRRDRPRPEGEPLYDTPPALDEHRRMPPTEDGPQRGVIIIELSALPASGNGREMRS